MNQIKESRTQRLIEAARKHEGKIRELGLALEKIVNAKNVSVKQQRYDESSALFDKEVALRNELESLLSK